MNIKEIIKVTINLVVIYIIGGVLLAWLFAQTSPVIYNNDLEDKANALKGMMPIHLVANAPEAAFEAIKASLPEGALIKAGGQAFDAEVDVYKKDKKKLVKGMMKAGALSVAESSDYKPEEKGTWEPVKKKHAKYYEVVKDGEVAGYIVESYHPGYAGAPGIFVAMDEDLTVRKVEVISHSETPGLGDEIEKPWFKNQYKGKRLEQLEVVKGEAGDKIQAITGATISTRAVTYAARDAVKLIQDYKAGAAAGPAAAEEAAGAGEGAAAEVEGGH